MCERQEQHKDWQCNLQCLHGEGPHHASREALHNDMSDALSRVGPGGSCFNLLMACSSVSRGTTVTAVPSYVLLQLLVRLHP